MPDLPRYTAIGNSIAAGGGGLLITTPYCTYYCRMLERQLGRRFRYLNRSYLFGVTMAEFLDWLRTDDDLRRELAGSEVVTFNIGENDLLRASRAYYRGEPEVIREVMRDFPRLYRQIVDEILDLVPRGQAIIRTFNAYNPDPDHPQGHLLQQVNRWIQQITAMGHNSHRRRIPMADVYSLFAQRPRWQVLGLDRLHPSIYGHQLIARALMDLGTDRV